MKLAILANEAQKLEWTSRSSPEKAQLLWVDSFEGLLRIEADAYFDLAFRQDVERLKALSGVNKPVFINAVIHPLLSSVSLQLQNGTGNKKVIDGQFYRINAWPTFLKREIAEIAGVHANQDERILDAIFADLQWRYRLVPDIPGFISARVIAMIINEAYFTLEAGVSTQEEIDTAMKLGTNYPLGPFEWSKKIGLKNVYLLLQELGKADSRYSPCELLKKESELE